MMTLIYCPKFSDGGSVVNAMDYSHPIRTILSNYTPLYVAWYVRDGRTLGVYSDFIGFRLDNGIYRVNLFNTEITNDD